jgi:Cytochrome P450
MACFTLAVALFITLAIFLLRCRRRHRVYTNYSDIATLLDPPHSPTPLLLSARARPNERLARAFGLGNSFVSADTRVRKEFIARARELLRKHTQRFAAFPDAARDTVTGVASHLLRSYHHQNATPFARFVQVVTMRLVVFSLLGGDIPQDTGEDVIFVVDTINELWASSKTHPTHTQAGVLERLNGHLSQWLPTYERPIDFIIPAYETMWRVVAVTVARAGRDRMARAAFSAYLNSPVEQYKRFDNGGPSVEAFLCEVLRLHPPSRRLARATPQFTSFPRWTQAADDVADLEALHQDIDTWGQEGHVFDPMRFHPDRLSQEQHRSFIPFGYGPLRCIAFKEAPHFAAIVAASILEVVRVDEPCGRYRLVCGERLGRREGWEGWAIEVGGAGG